MYARITVMCDDGSVVREDIASMIASLMVEQHPVAMDGPIKFYGYTFEPFHTSSPMAVAPADQPEIRNA